MTRALVTGADGFIGRHLVTALREAGVDVDAIGRGAAPGALDAALARTDVVFHMAGTNRPADPAEFEQTNAALTRHVADRLEWLGRRPLVVFASSAQAALDNAYGRSKRAAEEALVAWAERTGASARIYRLTNVFGRGGRPDYNSAVATFCHRAARGLPLEVSDSARPMRLVHVDDVVSAFVRDLEALSSPAAGAHHVDVGPVYESTLGSIATAIEGFAAARHTLRIPTLSDPLLFRLYSTFLTYLPADAFAYDLRQVTDARGTLAEFVKSPGAGQVFVSRTYPGITRGNHWHRLKAEKFLVLEGDAVVRFRAVDTSAADGPPESAPVLEYPVRGTDFRVVDIPPGFTHSIENSGDRELVVLFWASEVFDPARPDTQFVPVLTDA